MPTAILVGWLGCQQKYIQPYELLYKDLGFDTITLLPEPWCVMEAALRANEVELPDGWPIVDSHPIGPLRMQDLAWRLLARLRDGHNSPMLFHVFSNGGCFLWESIRRVLDLQRNISCPQPAQSILKTIEGRIGGVVFDSSPCWFGNGSNLSAALVYCSESEQKAIEEEFGITAGLKEGGANQVHYDPTRCSDYFAYLQQDELDIPQLYLCSKNDPLCDFEKVLEMVAQRRLHQICPVKVQFWSESKHCGHLRTDPQKYTEAVKYLSRLALRHSKL